MHIVNSRGEKIELAMDAVARSVIADLLLVVKEVDGIGLVLPNGDSFELKSQNWEEEEAKAMQKNIDAGKPARHNLAWSIKDRADLWVRFFSDHSMTFDTLAEEFERTPSGIRGQLQRMGIVDSRGEVIDPSRRRPEPRKRYIYGTLSSGRDQL